MARNRAMVRVVAPVRAAVIISMGFFVASPMYRDAVGMAVRSVIAMASFLFLVSFISLLIFLDL
jgi:hypothetical protein